MEKISRRDRERSVRREEIIDAAEQEFTKYGYENVSMDSIAKESQFTKRTVYQYFSSKEELFITVAARVHRRLIEYYKKELNKKRDSYKTLHAIGFAYVQFAMEHPESLILLKANFLPVDPSSPGLMELLAYRDEGLRIISELIRSGQKEKTIKSNLDPEKTALSITCLIVGYFHLIIRNLEDTNPAAIKGKHDMITNSLELIFQGIRK